VFDFNKDGKIDLRDVVIVGTLLTTLFNAFLNVLTVTGLGISLTSNDVPILDCRLYNVSGRTEIKCYRSDNPPLQVPDLNE